MRGPALLPAQETERFALLLKRHALAPFAAPAGLAATVACCMLALVHCRALEVSHGLTLAPRLMRDLWPACEQARRWHADHHSMGGGCQRVGCG